MRNNISKIKDCYGCGVCAKSCGKKIIDIKLNSDGFYEPYIIDDSQCNECGLCLNVCAYNYEEEPAFSVPLKSYASWSKNYNIRKICSSGGIGFEISKALINKGYKVCAVRYNNKINRAEHYLAENIDALIESVGSKYIQSYSVDAFKLIDLKEKYLITGTPCQIDSLRRYIRKFKKEDNFVLLDFFCHGVPSMLVWNKYIKSIEKETGTFISVEWRNKDTGWHDSWCMNVKGSKGVYMSKATKGDYFYQLFLRNACLNKACYSKCKYKFNKSSADLRIGDLWGTSYQENQDGVSALVSFTSKGNDVIKILQDVHLMEHPFKVVAEGQIENKLKEPRIIRKIILSLLRNEFISIKNITLIMRICLKLFR